MAVSAIFSPSFGAIFECLSLDTPVSKQSEEATDTGQKGQPLRGQELILTSKDRQNIKLDEYYEYYELWT